MKARPGEGTTTSARRLCRGALAVDRPEHASALRAGPDSVLGAMTKPLLIDEWQLAPEVLGAVKRAVDDDDTAGQVRRARPAWPKWSADPQCPLQRPRRRAPFTAPSARSNVPRGVWPRRDTLASPRLLEKIAREGVVIYASAA